MDDFHVGNSSTDGVPSVRLKFESLIWRFPSNWKLKMKFGLIEMIAGVFYGNHRQNGILSNKGPVYFLFKIHFLQYQS